MPEPAAPVVDDYVANTDLLNAELPDERFVDDSYLHWLYDDNPCGAAFSEHVDEDGVRVAHYALIPQRYRDAGGPQPFVFSLNAVSRSGAQRKGYFGLLQLRVWSRARDAGTVCGIGVTNARSHRGVQVMGWRFVGHHVDADLLAGDTFTGATEGLDEQPAEHWTNCWTPEYLRWRLGAPHGARFALHVCDDLAAVSTLSSFKGVPVAVLCKVMPRGRVDQPVPGGSTIAEICRFHKAPAAVYAGFNRWVRLRGVPLPHALKPAPLNLEVCSLSDTIGQREFRLDTYEFLDMDAY
jgi:hypothetical protein